MNAPARNLTEEAAEIESAVLPEYNEDQLREIAKLMVQFTEREPRPIFRQTVRTHRKNLQRLDSTGLARPKGSAVRGGVSLRNSTTTIPF